MRRCPRHRPLVGRGDPDQRGRWTFAVEAWSDPVATWHHDATIKIEPASTSS
jgi:hypothetical protein